MKNLFFIFVVLLFAACNNTPETTNDTTENATVNEPVAETKVDFNEAIQGKWSYKSSETTIGSTTTNIKVFDNWTMAFDGQNCTESIVMTTGEPETAASNPYHIQNDSLFRDNNVAVKLIKITDKELVFNSMNMTTMYFDKVE